MSNARSAAPIRTRQSEPAHPLGQPGGVRPSGPQRQNNLQNRPGQQQQPGRKRRDYALLVLAAGVFLFGAAAGRLYYVLRPVTLRIAVGPPGSDDQKLVQALAQTFAHDASPVRLSPITTEGAIESIALLTAKRPIWRSRAALRTCRPTPSRSPSCARTSWCCGRFRTSAKGDEKPAAPKVKNIDDLDGIGSASSAGRRPTSAIARDSDRVWRQSRQGDVTQFATNQIAEMAHDSTLDAFMAVGPLSSKITTEAIAATAKARGEPKFLPIDVSEAIAQKHPLYDFRGDSRQHVCLIAGAPRGQDRHRQRQPSDHRAEIAVGYRGRRIRPAIVHGARLARQGSAERGQDREAGYRQGRSTSRTPGRRGLYRRQRTHLPRKIHRLHLGRDSGDLGPRIGRRLAAALLEAGRTPNSTRRHRDRLLDLISRVRQAESQEELTTMQAEADSILRETLECYDDSEAIEEGDLAAISLALDQFNHAVADRRTTIETLAMKQFLTRRNHFGGFVQTSRNG